MNQLLQSSQNPEKLSLTVQGLLMSFVPIMIGIFQLFDIPLTEIELVEIVQAITTVIAGVAMIFGMVRKVINLRK